MKRKALVVILLVMIFISGCSMFSDSFSSNPQCPVDFSNGEPPEKIHFYFFYGNGCSHCAKVEPLINEIEKQYGEYIVVDRYEIRNNDKNREIYFELIEKHDIKNPGIPVVFMGNEYLMGDKAIEDNVITLINYNLINWEFCPAEIEIVGLKEGHVDEKDPVDKVDFTFFALISAAFIDSINPCAFSVLIFLLITLSSIGVRKKILKVGFVFILVVFVTYFLSGIGLFSFIQISAVTRVVYLVAAVLAIGAGLVNIKDFFWYGKGFSLKMSKSEFGILQKYMHKATIPASIVLGFLVSVFELPCTGSVYLAILSMLAKSTSMAAAIGYLLLYNFIFVLPLIVILFVVYYGIPAEKLDEWRLKKRKWLRLAMGLVMVLLGVVMLMGWV